MHPKSCWTALLSLAVGSLSLLACSGEAPSDAASDDALKADQTNAVQLVKASASGDVAFEKSLDWTQCQFSNRSAMSASEPMMFKVEAECTDMMARAQGRPMLNRYHEPVAFIREDPTLSYVERYHYCQEVDVTVAVKAATWDSPGFQGIGFYGHEPVLNDKPELQDLFYSKDDPRLARVGTATLRSGEKAYLYRFGGSGPCCVQGDGVVRARLEFKAYLRFDNGPDQWESVRENHQLAYDQAIDATRDVLR